VSVEHLPAQPDDGDGGRRPGIDADEDVVAALGQRAELDAVPALAFDLDPDVAGPLGAHGEFVGGGRDAELRPREPAVLLDPVDVVLEPGVVEFPLDLPGALFHVAVDASGVAVLRPATAAAGRAPAGHLHGRLVGEGGDLLADVHRRQPGCGLGFLHRLLAVGDAVPGGDPAERFGLFGAGHLDQLRPRREVAQKADEIVLVGRELVGVVRRDDGRLLAVDEPPELPKGDDVPVDAFPVEGDDRVRGGVAPDVARLDVDPEHDRVEGPRAGAHATR